METSVFVYCSIQCTVCYTVLLRCVFVVQYYFQSGLIWVINPYSSSRFPDTLQKPFCIVPGKLSTSTRNCWKTSIFIFCKWRFCEKHDNRLFVSSFSNPFEILLSTKLDPGSCFTIILNQCEKKSSKKIYTPISLQLIRLPHAYMLTACINSVGNETCFNGYSA